MDIPQKLRMRSMHRSMYKFKVVLPNQVGVCHMFPTPYVVHSNFERNIKMEDKKLGIQERVICSTN